MADIIVDGKTWVAFVSTIVNPAAPTVAELTAGEVLHNNLIPTGLEGFESSTAEIDNTALASTFDTKLPGRQSYSGTGLVLKKQDGTDDVFDLLTTSGTDGFIVIRDGVDSGTAPTTGDDVQVYPTRTGGWSMMGRGEANSVLRYRVATPVTAEPQLKATVGV